MIITRTPFRLSFFGGGTDYNPWFQEKGGLVISSALAYYCYISVRRLPPFFNHHSRIVYSKIENAENNRAIEHPSVRGCLEYFGIQEGLEIHHDGDLPAQSGLGSSSSFTVGLSKALRAFQGNIVSPETLVNDAIQIEQNLLRESVGVQDQIMAALGGIRVLRLGPGPSWTTEPLVLSAEYLQELQEYLLIGFTGKSRLSGKSASAIIENIRHKENDDALSSIKSIAEAGLDLFSRAGGMKDLGGLLDESWRLKRSLASGVSSDDMDSIYTTARRNGAFGGKLMGAGGGGFFFFIAPPKDHVRIKSALKQVKVWVPYRVDTSGSQIIFLTQGQR